MRWKKRTSLFLTAAAIAPFAATGYSESGTASPKESEKQFSLVLGPHSTRCLSVGASADTMERYLEELPNVDGVRVVRSGDGNSKYSYSVTFDGDELSRGNQDEIWVDQNTCNTSAYSSNSYSSKVTTVQDGVVNGGASFHVAVSGSPDTCNTNSERSTRPADVKSLKENGEYSVTFTPTVAGAHTISLTLQTSGGLKGTYYRTMDFSDPLLGNEISTIFPYHENRWCPEFATYCDSTRLDPTINFHWGAGVSLFDSNSFPFGYFSVRWEGFVQVPTSDNYVFHISLSGGVKLSIDSVAIIDEFPSTLTEVNSDSLYLESTKKYSIFIEYAHSTDDAFVSLMWSTATLPMEIVPSSSLYYSRHISSAVPNIKTSPFAVAVLPGSLSHFSTASGNGLNECTATHTCSLNVISKDANKNDRYNDGSNNFEVQMVGTNDWAGQGRNDDDTGPNESIRVIPNISYENWKLIGKVNVKEGASYVTSLESFLLDLNRGDSIAVGGLVHTVADDGVFNKKTIPLESQYIRESDTGVNLYKIGEKCMAGTVKVDYIPQIRGEYELHIRIPEVREIQRLSASASLKSSLAGSFLIVLHDR